MQQGEFAQLSGFNRHKPTLVEKFRDGARDFKCLQMVKNTIPVLEWLPKYSCKNYFMGDLMAGVTVAVMHIPQGKVLIFNLKAVL